MGTKSVPANFYLLDTVVVVIVLQSRASITHNMPDAIGPVWLIPCNFCGITFQLEHSNNMKGFNKYQLQEELKKALHNRKQDNARYFFYDDFLTIEYNDQSDWIYSDWKGYQTESSVKDGCEKLYNAVKAFYCSKILNDNTNVIGIWTPASAWVGGTWLPRMKEAGLKYFAWVYSPSALSRLSTDESIRNTDVPDMVQTFEDIKSARRWLSGK